MNTFEAIVIVLGLLILASFIKTRIEQFDPEKDYKNSKKENNQKEKIKSEITNNVINGNILIYSYIYGEKYMKEYDNDCYEDVLLEGHNGFGLYSIFGYDRSAESKDALMEVIKQYFGIFYVGYIVNKKTAISAYKRLLEAWCGKYGVGIFSFMSGYFTANLFNNFNLKNSDEHNDVNNYIFELIHRKN